MKIFLSKNMKSTNKKRAEILHKLIKPDDQRHVEPEERIEDEFDEDVRLEFDCYDLNCKFTVNGMCSKLLHSHTYTLKENRLCSECDTSGNYGSRQPIITAHLSLKLDFTNIEQAIKDNFYDPKCSACDKKYNISREFGAHAFIEVRYFILLPIII